ncbi:MAG: hypothetical protein FWF81_13755 [Defluviitaleaceae bacterium]|nr:hypothetical protein [Defluviitaleaceae bacterium]
MSDQIKKYIDPLRARWDILTPPQRYKLLGVFAAILVALILMAFFALRTPWETIVSGQNRQIIDPMRIALDEAGINNRTRNHGSALQVDARRVDEALGTIITEGAVPNSEHFTWGNALDTGLGTTDSERRRLDVLGMQGQVERQLMMMNGISGADVVLTIPNSRPFDRNAPMPSAAVTLITNEDFSATQGRNLAMLVARNVSQLELDRIVILDQFMRTIFSGEEEAHDVADQAQQMRSQHNNNVMLTTMRLLSPIFDEIAVAFNPVYDDTLITEELVRLYNIPDGMESTGIVQHDTGMRFDMEGSQGGLEPGLQPQTATFPNYAMTGDGVMSAAHREWGRHYVVNSIERATTSGPGWVDPERSFGSVVATRNRTMNQEHWLAEDENRTVADWERFKNEETAPTLLNGSFDDFEAFHELVASAMGIPSSNVELVIMERIIPVDTVTRAWPIETIIMVAVLLLLMAMLLFGLLRRQRAAGDEEEGLEPQLAVEDLLVSTQLEEAKEEAASELEEIDYFKENEIKKHIEKFVNEKPEAVAALLRNWINVEEW